MSRAVLFDIDGTLVDSTYHHAVAWHRAFARHDLTPPLWRIHRSIGMGGDKLVAHVTDDDVEDRWGDELRDAWRTEYLELRTEVRPLPGARQLVVALRRDGYRVALASSGDPQFAEEAVDLLGIGDDIELLTTSADVDASKPEPDLVGETLRRLGLGPLGEVQQAALVGDTVYDVEAAARAGIACVGVRSGGVSRAELLEAGAVAVGDALEDLLDVPWRDHLSAITPPTR